MAHDVFVSYSSNDKTAADAIVAGLEQKGIRCWVAPRDLTPGMSWGKGIIDAIEASKVMVVILSGNSNESRQVAREVERAVSKEVAVIPFRIENIDPTGDMAYFLASEHWLDAITPPLERHIDKLANVIKLFLADQGEAYVSDAIIREPPKELPKETVKEKPWWSRGSTIGITLGFVVLFFICIGVALLSVFVIIPRLRGTPTAGETQISQVTPGEVLLTPTHTETIAALEEAQTPTLAPEPTQSPSPTATVPSGNLNLPAGWIEYTTDEFSIGLPESWEIVDIDEEGMQALMDLLSQYDPAWAEALESTYMGEAVTPPIFFAMDTEMVGMGYSNVNITKETFPLPFPMRDLCAEIDTLYAQMGMNIIDSNCDLSINGLDAARYNIETRVGNITTQQYQYIIRYSTTYYFISLSVDQSGWSNYQSIFEGIGESFTIPE